MALHPLSEDPGFRFPRDAFDVRGWRVRTGTDESGIGVVEDILVDDRGELRYLDVDPGFMQKHVLVPLSRAHVDAVEDVVWVDEMSRDDLAGLPEYTHDPSLLTPDYERKLNDLFRPHPLRRADDAPGNRPREEGLPLTRLEALDDHRVAKGSTDPRGWTLRSADGQKVGQVKELLVDADSLDTRFLDCSVEEKKLELEPLDRHVLVPVERVRLDGKKKEAVVTGLFAHDLEDYPVYRGLPVTRQDEQELRRIYHRHAAAEPEENAHTRSGRRFFAARLTRNGDGVEVDGPGLREAAPAAPAERPGDGSPAPGAEDGQWHQVALRDGEMAAIRHGQDEVRLIARDGRLVVERGFADGASR